ncbi:MAG: NUDIX domain-containing protein [Eubacteriaceae bacterium]|nr:NUDIX domain-containing protein [Eubacteriaceae bacterium]
MQGYNLVWVFNQQKDKVLMCKRHKDPYLGLYNLLGGKIEPGESGLDSAKRELWEEAGILSIDLVHLMDLTYHLLDSCYIQVYFGFLDGENHGEGDEKELVWMDVAEDFFDMDRFAGEGNIGHIYQIILQNTGMAAK